MLLYVPGHILVLSTPWALERARTDCKLMVASDAKVDTVAGVVSKWSSIRTKTARGLSVPLTVWISPEENSTTVEEGATALAVNVACDKPDCDHAFIIEYGRGGSIRMRRRCPSVARGLWGRRGRRLRGGTRCELLPLPRAAAFRCCRPEHPSSPSSGAATLPTPALSGIMIGSPGLSLLPPRASLLALLEGCDLSLNP